MIRKLIILSLIYFLLPPVLKAQENKSKFWLSGNARGVFYLDELDVPNQNDTITPKKLNNGHTLVDLGANIKPNENTFIHAMIRVRNDFGGFWGSGITFDLRKLYIKGLIANSIRYQIGDFNYKLTPYTYYNSDEAFSKNPSALNIMYKEMINTDLFYYENTWHQQGAAIDFGLEFEKLIDEVHFDLFTSRINPTDFSYVSERLISGGNMTVSQSKFFKLGFNYVYLFDWKGTSKSDQFLHNPVFTTKPEVIIDKENYKIKLDLETGFSKSWVENDTSSNVLEDYFYDVNLNFELKKYKTSFDIKYINVGPKFRSAAAQTMRVAFENQPQEYTLYGNDQSYRQPGLLDYLQDISLYNSKLNIGLDYFNPVYGNINPYGIASPNRKGLDFSIKKHSNNELYDIELNYGAFSEVVGQGTNILRNFQRMAFFGKFNLDKLLSKYDKKVEATYTYQYETTTRDDDFNEGDIDFKVSYFDIGLCLGLYKDFEFLSSYTILRAKGNELLPIRNSYTEVIDFNEFEAGLKESVLSFGLRYNFSSNNILNVIYQKSQTSNNLATDYSINRFAIVYQLKF